MVGHERSQLGSGAIDPRFYGSQRQLQGIRDVFVGEIIGESQQKDFAVVVAEQNQISVERFERFASLGSLARTGARVGRIPTSRFVIGVIDRRIERISLALSSAFEPSMAVLDLVIDDAAEPGPEFRFASKLMDLPKAKQENFLGEVIGFVMVLEAIERSAPDPILEMAHQILEGVAITSLRCADPPGYFIGIAGGGTWRIAFLHL